ncbi:hypothetical protein NE237_032514 [Protea cynaroides]|uniref:Uncharacterized protein n=1 Tax=Protea cynaroides TaxID=273540 RepID=A0A9Q0L3G5_9MAGN|nr:hypothetical protein NE237_032514 [Protea cynaroides]
MPEFYKNPSRKLHLLKSHRPCRDELPGSSSLAGGYSTTTNMNASYGVISEPIAKGDMPRNSTLQSLFLFSDPWANAHKDFHDRFDGFLNPVAAVTTELYELSKAGSAPEWLPTNPHPSIARLQDGNTSKPHQLQLRNESWWGNHQRGRAYNLAREIGEERVFASTDGRISRDDSTTQTHKCSWEVGIAENCS